jgi:rSAM/selenodomain-associated transferase 1
MTRPPAVAVMAKVPGATAVKSRLHPLLGASLATRLYDCFLRDRLDALATVTGIERVVAFTPPEARDTMARIIPAGFTLVPQRGVDLGARLDGLLADLLAAGHRGAIAIDSDSPTLPMLFIAEAARALAASHADVVVGPCDDGGYYLIGLRRPHPELFDAMPWSTERVLPLTLERARRHGLRTHVLPAWFDVDTEADLVRLRDALAMRSTGPRRTLALIREMAGAGVFAAAHVAIPATSPRRATGAGGGASRPE